MSDTKKIRIIQFQFMKEILLKINDTKPLQFYKEIPLLKLTTQKNTVFFYVHWVVLVATWSLPPATFNYQNCQKSQKCVQRFSRSLPQLPATTKIVKISKSVYGQLLTTSYLQLPYFSEIVGRKVYVRGSQLAATDYHLLEFVTVVKIFIIY